MRSKPVTNLPGSLLLPIKHRCVAVEGVVSAAAAATVVVVGVPVVFGELLVRLNRYGHEEVDDDHVDDEVAGDEVEGRTPSYRERITWCQLFDLVGRSNQF